MNTNYYDFAPEKNKIEKGVLYLVATPVGNMADISERALKILNEADFVAAEDTRNSGKLLSGYGIKQSYVAYHEHNKAEAGQRIAERLLNGETCALITDAGMPAVSDPGEDIVKLCAEKGIKVTCAPGPCAFITALVLSGLNTRRFCFEGFLSARDGERKKTLEGLKDEDRTLIFYEAPHKLRTTLDDMLKIFGNRRIALCRELTKLNEDIIRTDLSSAVELYRQKEPRGEYVLVLDGAMKKQSNDWADLTVEEHINFYVKEGLSKMDAIKKVAKERGVPKGEIYKLTVKG